MPTRNKRVKQETRVDKVASARKGGGGRPKSTELPGCGSPEHMEGASLALLPCGSQSRRDQEPLAEARENGKVTSSSFVPVLAKNGNPLMPCSPYRARRLMGRGAKGRFSKGVFHIKLERESGEVQKIALGIDPGSKREAYTVKSSKHTFLNVLSYAVTWVKDAVETRRNMRRARRSRKTPYRQNRMNRGRGGISPSTKARWQAKLRIVEILSKLYPVTDVVVEDVKSKTYEGKGKWNSSFSPLEVGKKWFYGELKKKHKLTLFSGWETKLERDRLGLRKIKGKMEEVFEAHNVDSWVLANKVVEGHSKPDNISIYVLIPLRLHRRTLHALQPSKGGGRRLYGGTMSMGFKRGSLVNHRKWGICYVGGTQKHKARGKLEDRVSLHSLETQKRLCRNARKEQTKSLAYNGWGWRKAQ